MNNLDIYSIYGVAGEYCNTQRFWYDHWMFCEKFFNGYSRQGLVRPSANEAGSRAKVKAHPMFTGLTSITTKTNEEQPVRVVIYYISSTGSEFSSFCTRLVSDIDEAQTAGRTFKCTNAFYLDWKFNMNKMTKEQFDNLKKYNKIEYKD